MDDMKQLSREQRAAVVRCLVEGNSIRSTVRITGVSKNTIQKLTRDLGEAREQLALRNAEPLPLSDSDLEEV